MATSKYAKFFHDAIFRVLEFPDRKCPEGKVLRIEIRTLSTWDLARLQQKEGEGPEESMDRVINATAFDPETGEQMFPAGGARGAQVLLADVGMEVAKVCTEMVNAYKEGKKNSRKTKSSG